MSRATAGVIFSSGSAAHQPQRALQPLLGQHAQERRLPQLDFERLLQRVVEHRLAGAVREIGEDDGVALGKGAVRFE